jgi:hypothetical protein
MFPWVTGWPRRKHPKAASKAGHWIRAATSPLVAANSGIGVLQLGLLRDHRDRNAERRVIGRRRTQGERLGEIRPSQ